MGTIVMITAVDTDTWIAEAMLTVPHAEEATSTSDAEPTYMLTVKDRIRLHQASEYTAHATDVDTDTHAEISITATTATDSSVNTDPHQAHHATPDSESTATDHVTIVMITAVDTDTWIAEAMLTVPHAEEATSTSVAEPTYMLTVKDRIRLHQALEYTAHATDADTDTHAEISITATTATDSSVTTEPHQAHHATPDSESTATDHVTIVMITAVDTDTWIAEAT